MNLNFGSSKAYIKTPDGKMLPIGEIKAMLITRADGQTITSGPAEEVFELRMTDADKELLDAMKIGQVKK